MPQPGMTMRQKILAMFYPLLMFFQKHRKGQVHSNAEKTVPLESFYELKLTLNDGTLLPVSHFKGRKVLIVNTASDCGYTAQYGELQKLYGQMAGRLEIIAFPSNEFKEQEKGSDEGIATFCRNLYGVHFPIAKKSNVKKSSVQNEVFQWLTRKEKNGWNDQEPQWNFSKYLVNEQGIL